jgi:hypothetical protein
MGGHSTHRRATAAGKDFNSLRKTTAGVFQPPHFEPPHSILFKDFNLFNLRRLHTSAAVV